MRRVFKTVRWVVIGGAIAAVALSVAAVLPWRWVDPPTTAFMLQDRWANDRAPNQQWVGLEHISPELQIAVVASEDQLFPVHHGFDIKSIAEALDEPAGRRRGASTISQQVAKNLYLWSGRSYPRKALEAWLTVLIELFWDKRRILEVYLNIAEFGRGTYGAFAASTTLFGKSPLQLTRYEAALLAAVLPNPKGRRADRPSAYVHQRAGEIMMSIEALGGPGYLRGVTR
jgi:monofunctional biosynthetic peptidoglycan transglycosylase